MGKLGFFVVLGLLSSLDLVAQDLPPFIENTLRPFTTDGCSQSDDGNWKHCCVAHDIWYWKGGTWDQKKAADLQLKACMKEAGATESLAQQYYIVTRVAGAFLQKTKYRWGNGWRYLRGLTPWSENELSQIQRLEPTLEEAMKLKLDGSPGEPAYLPTVTGNLCMDVGIYEILEAAKKFGEKQIVVDRLVEALELGGNTVYRIGIKNCKKAIELPLRVSADYCEGRKYSLLRPDQIFRLNKVNRQVERCYTK